MEIKKNPEVDVQKKRFLLLEIGLLSALLIAIGALCYTVKEIVDEDANNDKDKEYVEEEMVEITRQEEEPKPEEIVKPVEVKVLSDVLEIVTNDEKVDTKLDFNDFADEMTIDIMPVGPAVDEEVVEDDAPFVRVEQMPSFRGGDISTFRSWVMERIRYPQIAMENGITGRVLLQFVVERDGTLTNIQVLQTPDSSLSDEAIRILKSSPKWTPGKQGNKTVRVKYVLPVDFRIQN